MKSTLAWIAALAVLITFCVLDAGAVAWSASVINGHQLSAAVLTFFVVLSGAAITVWRMRLN
jgi:hypothetical protein